MGHGQVPAARSTFPSCSRGRRRRNRRPWTSRSVITGRESIRSYDPTPAGRQGGAGEDPRRRPHRPVGGQPPAVAVHRGLLAGDADPGAPLLPKPWFQDAPHMLVVAGQHRGGVEPAGRVELHRDGPRHRHGPHDAGRGERRRGHLLGGCLRARHALRTALGLASDDRVYCDHAAGISRSPGFVKKGQKQRRRGADCGGRTESRSFDGVPRAGSPAASTRRTWRCSGLSCTARCR